VTYYITSDTHIQHENIIKYCDRPFRDIKEMNNTIIYNWNKVVKQEDTVIFCGDFGFFKRGPHNLQHYLDKLNGNIIPIKGNHDNKELGLYSPIEGMVLKINGVDVWVSHRPEFKYKFNFCGHVHDKWLMRKKDNKHVLNVGVDMWNFTPIRLDYALEYLNNNYKEAQEYIY